MNVVETSGLGKRYGRTWALRECTLAVPAGHAAAAADGVSVLLSSHVLAELERVADYLILLSRGRVRLAGEVDGLLASHRLLTGPGAEVDRYAGRPVVHPRRAKAQAHLLVQATADDPVPPGWTGRPASLEELALAYLREPGAVVLHGPGRDQRTQQTPAGQSEPARRDWFVVAQLRRFWR